MKLKKNTRKSTPKSRNKKIDESPLGLCPVGTLADLWWERASLEAKDLALELAWMMVALKRGQRIEIRKEQGRIETRFSRSSSN